MSNFREKNRHNYDDKREKSSEKREDRKRKVWKQPNVARRENHWRLILALCSVLMFAGIWLLVYGCIRSGESPSNAQAYKIAGYCCVGCAVLPVLIYGLIIHFIKSHNRKAKKINDKEKQ